MANVVRIKYRTSGTTTPANSTFQQGELGFSEEDGRLYIGDSSGNTVHINPTGGAGTWGSIGGTITDQTDLVNYIAGQITGIDAKESVRAATTANITLSGTQTIDGVSVVATDRVLVKNQTSDFQNGIYVVNAGAWTRAEDMDSWDEVPSGFVFVEEGATLADTGWVATADAGGTLGTTGIPWVQFSSAGSYTADGQGIELNGSTFELELDGSTLSKSASGLAVATGGITDTQIAAGAAIAFSKLAALTTNAFTFTDGTGVVSAVAGAGPYSILRRNAADNGFEASQEIFGGTFS